MPRHRAAVSPEMRGELFDRVHTYALAMDERSRDLLESCLAPDVVWSGSVMGQRQLEPVSGRAAVVAWLTHDWVVDRSQSRRLFLNVLVTDVANGHAVIQAYVLHTRSTDVGAHLRSSGVYRFRLRQDEGLWLVTAVDAGYDADLEQDGEDCERIDPDPRAAP